MPTTYNKGAVEKSGNDINGTKNLPNPSDFTNHPPGFTPFLHDWSFPFVFLV